MHRAISRSILALLIAGWVVPLTNLQAQTGTIEDDIEQTRNRLQADRAEHLQLIAPRHFDKAAGQLEEAERQFAAGGKIEDIRRKLAEAAKQLTRCEDFREIGSLLLRDAIEARGDALTSNAPEFAPELWANAEQTIRKAGQKIVDGNQTRARKEADKAIHLYREAELLAIRVDILGQAKELRVTAIGLKATELAQTTLVQADAYLADAERVLESDRYEKSEAKRLAETAAEEYRHAARIAEAVAVLDEDRKGGPERLIRGYEAEFVRIAHALDFAPYFSEGVTPITEQVLAAISSRAEDRSNLQSKLEETQVQLDGLEARLGPLEEREAELRLREKRERTMRDVRGLFTSDEAEVLSRGDQLIVRLYGLSFPSGSAEIRPDNFALLTKVLRVLREFPKAPVAIEGHTDSQGDDNYNQELSQRRANAVREYILANMNVDGEWIMAVGYGESRPIANNETADGRAKNRRIDILVELIGS